MSNAIEQLHTLWSEGLLIPYVGPGATPAGSVPAVSLNLARALTSKSAVPFKLRDKLSAAAQYIENFKHRKTLVSLMHEQFGTRVAPTDLHRALVQAPLVVHAWYDTAFHAALSDRSDWGCVQGVSHAEHFGEWFAYYDAAGELVAPEATSTWSTLLYEPLGADAPARNFIVSDSDYVEVLTEIDIQTPIPPQVQAMRSGRSFVFIGCRFADQLERSYARQVMKRSGTRHWAIIEGELTRNEAKFLQEQGIERVDMSLTDFTSAFLAGLAAPA